MRRRPQRFVGLLVVVAIVSSIGPAAAADESTLTQAPAYVHAELWTDSTSFRFYAEFKCEYPTQMLGREWASLNEMERAVTQYLWDRDYLTTETDPANIDTGTFEIAPGHEGDFNDSI